MVELGISTYQFDTVILTYHVKSDRKMIIQCQHVAASKLTHNSKNINSGENVTSCREKKEEKVN